MYKFKIKHFNPTKIALSGQCFRWKILDSNHVELIALGKYLQIADLGDNLFAFSCTEEEFLSIWKNYFDIDFDYSKIITSIKNEDIYLKKAATFSEGIRILRQELWETLISYIISQRKSIPTISKAVNDLSFKFGNEIKVYENEELHNAPFISPSKKIFYSFPSVKQLSFAKLDELKKLGLGYRAEYIFELCKTATRGEIDLEALRNLPFYEQYSKLLKIYGVGPKIANCTLLFGYHQINAFPVDTWIKKIIDTHYNGEFDASCYAGYEGIIQQYMFYYERNH